MIIYASEPLNVHMNNVMMLDDISGNGGIIYVGKTTYDQCVKLHARYEGSLVQSLDAIFGRNAWSIDTPIEQKKVVEDIFNQLPEPVNMLAPFLIFLRENSGIKWDETFDVRKAVGYIHIMSQMIDFYAVGTIPAAIRAQVSFPTVSLNMYESSWKDLTDTLRDRTVVYLSKEPIEEKPAEPEKEDTLDYSKVLAITPRQTNVEVVQPEEVAEESNDSDDDVEMIDPTEHQLTEEEQDALWDSIEVDDVDTSYEDDEEEDSQDEESTSSDNTTSTVMGVLNFFDDDSVADLNPDKN